MAIIHVLELWRCLGEWGKMVSHAGVQANSSSSGALAM